MSGIPDSVDSFWAEIDRQLSEVPQEVNLERDDFYSQPDWDVFQMRYTGLKGYRLFAWLSIPHGSGPFPALLRMPDYGSVHDLIYTPLRSQAIVMNPTYRGQRKSDVPYQASYPGLLTEGIEDPAIYVMPLVFADGIRALEALVGLSQSSGKVALTGAGLGGSLALFTANRRPQVQAVASDTPLMLGNPEALEQAAAYPLAELQDYLRVHPQRRDTILENTAAMDPMEMARRISVQVLLSLGDKDRGQCPINLGRLLAERLPHCDLRVYQGAGEGGGHEHGLVRTQWLKERLGADRDRDK